MGYLKLCFLPYFPNSYYLNISLRDAKDFIINIIHSILSYNLYVRIM